MVKITGAAHRSAWRSKSDRRKSGPTQDAVGPACLGGMVRDRVPSLPLRRKMPSSNQLESLENLYTPQKPNCGDRLPAQLFRGHRKDTVSWDREAVGRWWWAVPRQERQQRDL
jgi:hypothetical protein